jgi:hypothetical protein
MTPLSEPFHQYLVLDIIRCLVAPAAWILSLVVARLAILRWRNRRDDETWEKRTHPIAMLSYTIAVCFIGIRRADQLGGPFDPYLLPALAILTTGYIGVFMRIRVKSPLRRRRR